VSAILLGCAAEPADAASASAPPDVTVRAFLTNYAATVAVPLLGLGALLTGWTLSAAAGWPAAVAAVGTLAAGTAMWLRRRTWSPGLVHLVTWGAPAALLVPSAAAGLLSADGLVLWAPMTTALAVCLALTHEPLWVGGRRGPTG
jgi:hypothetical protein